MSRLLDSTNPHRRSRLGAGAALLTGTLLLAGCAGSGNGETAATTAENASPAAGTTGDPTGTPSGETGAKSGGTLTFAVGSDAGCVDPQQVGSNDTIYSVRQLVDSLTDQDPETGEIVPWLAESWEVSPDATTFTFHLRSGVTFSDGSELDAQDVKDTFDAVPDLGPLGTLPQGYLAGATTTVVDPLTVEVSFAESNAQFLQATTTHSLGIVSSESAAAEPTERCSDGIVGSGPFTLGGYVPSQEIALVKRAGYDWGSALFTTPGEANLDSVVFKVVPEAGVRTGSLTSGQVDAIGAVGKADESVLEASGVNLLGRANPGVVFNLGLNNSTPLFQDKAVRQAISLGIDRDAIVSSQLPSGTKAASSILSGTTPFYADQSESLRFDAAQASSLLAAAGWTAGDDGILVKDGARLSFAVSWFPVYSPNQPSLELIQQQLKAIGVEVQLTQIQIPEIAKIQQSGDFDALWGNLTRADPDILRAQYGTGGLNAYRIPAGPLDDLLTGQAAAGDPAERADLVAQAQQTIVSEVYVVPVFELQSVLGVAPRVHDLKFDASSRIQLHDTWVD